MRGSTGPTLTAENYRTHTLHVPNSGDGSVSVMNLTACSALNVSGCARKPPVIRVGHIPLGLAVDQATNTVYGANAFGDAVTVDPVTNTVFVTHRSQQPTVMSSCAWLPPCARGRWRRRDGKLMACMRLSGRARGR